MAETKRLTLLERFMKFTKIGPDCWEWTGAKNMGYGVIGKITPGDERLQKAHRVAWFLAHGIWPKGSFVCHACDNPSCVKPSHLFLGTATDNRRDAIAKGRQSGLTPEQIKYVKASTLRNDVLAEELGVHRRTIQLHRNG